MYGILTVPPLWCAPGAEFREDVGRRANAGDNERGPDVASAGHAQRRRRGRARRRQPRGVSVVIATAPVAATGRRFWFLQRS